MRSPSPLSFPPMTSSSVSVLYSWRSSLHFSASLCRLPSSSHSMLSLHSLSAYRNNIHYQECALHTTDLIDCIHVHYQLSPPASPSIPPHHLFRPTSCTSITACKHPMQCPDLPIYSCRSRIEGAPHPRLASSHHCFPHHCFPHPTVEIDKRCTHCTNITSDDEDDVKTSEALRT